MSPFDIVRENVTARQVAEYYGLKVNRNGMACCPFHDDRSPSMKIDNRYYCFGCLAKGDAVDYVARLFGLGPKDAAEKICADFGLAYDRDRHGSPPRAKPIKTKKTDEQLFKEAEKYLHPAKYQADTQHGRSPAELLRSTDEIPHPVTPAHIQFSISRAYRDNHITP